MNTQSNSAQISEQATQLQDLYKTVAKIAYWTDVISLDSNSRANIQILADEAESLLALTKLMRQRVIDGGVL